ncbi:MAG: hypothetical protein ABW022_23855 [Actinoplanes sp.]
MTTTTPIGQRAVWTALILLFATIVAAAAGVIDHLGGAGVPNAILVGGSAFAGTTLLLLAVAHFLSGRG